MKEHRERRERDLAIAAVAGDEQRMRAAYAERIGAGERRRSRAAKVWTALHTRAAYAGRRPEWSSPAAVQPDSGSGTRSDIESGYSIIGSAAGVQGVISQTRMHSERRRHSTLVFSRA